MISGLRDDALSLVDGGFALRVGLPWIRSLPLAGVSTIAVTVDGRPLDDHRLRVRLGSRLVRPVELARETATWWYVQDRLVLVADLPLSPGDHDVAVELRVAVPHLPVGPEVLVLPLRMRARLGTAHRAFPHAGREVGAA